VVNITEARSTVPSPTKETLILGLSLYDVRLTTESRKEKHENYYHFKSCIFVKDRRIANP